MDELIFRLRNTKSRSKRGLLDTAADNLEVLYRIVSTNAECETCVHFDDLQKCGDIDYIPCHMCAADCYCKDCSSSSKWEWPVYGLERSENHEL